MSSFTPPHVFVQGNTLDADELRDNNRAAKDYVNQQIIQADLDIGTFDFDKIQAGELEPISNSHTFTTGSIYGKANNIEPVNRAYYTSHIKPGLQTDTSIFVWQSIYETGTSFELEQDADILINFGATFFSQENDVQSKARHATKVVLRYHDGTSWNDIEGSRAFSFEETYDTTGAGTIVGAPSNIPNNVSGYASDYYLERSFRRWIGWAWKVSLPAGTYKFGVFVNARVESGYSSARSFTAEVFYT